MHSFLITFKPMQESPERGWPIQELQNLIRRLRTGEHVEEKWRFHNRKDVSLRDRVFLLCQGKGGPTIIGYGRIAGEPENNAGKWRVPIEFESLVDPTTEVLASREDLLAMKGAQRVWRSQASGVKLSDGIATELEMLVVGKPGTHRSEGSSSNPDWTRDELIVALNFYLKHRPNPPGKHSKNIVELSRMLNRLGEKLFAPEDRARTFRNENGVYMKLMNFRRLDPYYTEGGRSGLVRGGKAEEDVWKEFADDAVRCRNVAEAIMASLEDPGMRDTWVSDIHGMEEAPEGRLLTRKHLARERNRKLVDSKLKHAIKVNGRLVCEVCGFDFVSHYGIRGKGFIECHHTKPLASVPEGHTTHVDELALVCANCHRMIHRAKPWLSVSELKSLINR
jgi:5-methylcytosine-specific restriction enzyme A